MTDFAMQDIDAFLINPTVGMSDKHYALSSSETQDSESVFVNGGSKLDSEEPAQMKATIRDFTDKFVFPQPEYASSEEAASPTDLDDSSLQFMSSDNGSTDSLDEESSLEDFYEDAEIVQLPTRAQTVKFVSAGKPKVVMVPRSTDVSSAESSPTFSDDGQAILFGSSKSLARSRYNVGDRRRRSRPDLSLAGPAEITRPKRSPALPRLDAAPTSVPPLSRHSQTPLSSQKASFVKQDPFPANWPLPSPTMEQSSASPKRRLPKLSTSFGFRNFSTPRRNDSCSSTNSSASAGSSYRVEPRSPPMDMEYAPRTIPLHYRPKMVPRGASERAPTLTLPPCPDDYDDQWDIPYISPRSAWDHEAELTTPLTSPDIEPFNYVKSLRRKSLSAANAFATARV